MVRNFAIPRKIDPYKFSKFHTAPSIKSFFDSIESTSPSTTNTTLLEKYITISPSTNIHFRHMEEFDNTNKYIQIGYNNFYGNNIWNSEIQELFVSHLIAGIRLDVPTRLSSEDILSEGRIFSPINHEDGRDEYTISLKNAMKRYGTKNMDAQIKNFEDMLNKKFISANKLIYAEES